MTNATIIESAEKLLELEAFRLDYDPRTGKMIVIFHGRRAPEWSGHPVFLNSSGAFEAGVSWAKSNLPDLWASCLNEAIELDDLAKTLTTI